MLTEKTLNTRIQYNRPPYLQPTIYLESAPLYPTILGLTRDQVFIIIH
jgi:hypothetical protein